MEHLVVSLETAKKLKAAGFPQNTIYMWGSHDDLGLREDYKELWQPKLHAAPTAQEIADQLPKSRANATLTILWYGDKYEACYQGSSPLWEQSIGSHAGKTIAEALSLLWLEVQGKTNGR